MHRSKPPWLKVRAPGGERYAWIKERSRERKLHTVCEEAHCPNIGECWGGGTATFMVMGDICTRGCRFCAVETRRRGAPLDRDEPANVARTIAEMKLSYVVVTSVDRDDLHDQGAGHFAACVREIRAAAPQTFVEVLIPDFQGQPELVRTIVEARPDVISHNLETVDRLTPRVRDPRASYRQSLDVLRMIKEMDGERLTKSSLMVGHGESELEVLQAMGDLRAASVDFLTLGQYLRPSEKYLPVVEYIHPEVFERYRELGLGLGFKFVASGPLVRSSYRAGEFFIHEYLSRGGTARVVPAGMAEVSA